VLGNPYSQSHNHQDQTEASISIRTVWAINRWKMSGAASLLDDQEKSLSQDGTGDDSAHDPILATRTIGASTQSHAADTLCMIRPRLPLPRRSPTESRTVPSLRVLAVVLLVGMGATAAAVSGPAEPGKPDSDGDKRLSTAPSGLSVVAPVAFDARAENRRPGTARWRIGRAEGSRGDLAGYANALSVLPGQRVALSVTGEGRVRVRAFRIGWYGGVGARQIWAGAVSAKPEAGRSDTPGVRGWADTTGWPEGHYLLRLDRGEAARYLPLTVRTADNRGRIVVLTSPLTWQAENRAGLPAKASTDTAQVTTADLPQLSFNRPYGTGYGSAGFLPNDAGIIQVAERTGRRIGYATDHDVATDPGLLSNAAAVVIGGDSRYWTASLRETIRAVQDAGTNVASFGAGTGSRRIRLIDKGRAMQVSQAKPSGSLSLTGMHPSCPAAGPQRSSGAGRVAGDTDGPAADWVVRDATWWGYRGAGVRTGDVLPDLVSNGTDRADTASADSPRPMQLLSSTEVPCRSGPKNAFETVVQSGVYLVRPSGAAVFAPGTGRWACAVANACTDDTGSRVRLNPRTRRMVTRVTGNIINGFAEKSAGERLPAKNSAARSAGLQ
jgi:N,N-dimethylformamidase beta subunit-like protein